MLHCCHSVVRRYKLSTHNMRDSEMRSRPNTFVTVSLVFCMWNAREWHGIVSNTTADVHLQMEVWLMCLMHNELRCLFTAVNVVLKEANLTCQCWNFSTK
jgi:hypothetical protein